MRVGLWLNLEPLVSIAKPTQQLGPYQQKGDARLIPSIREKHDDADKQKPRL